MKKCSQKRLSLWEDFADDKPCVPEREVKGFRELGQIRESVWD